MARWCYGAAAASIAVVESAGLRYVAADGATGDAIVGTTLSHGKGIAGFVAATGQSIIVHDLENDPRFARDVAERVGYVPRSIQCVPFHDADGDVAGVISLLDRAEHEPPTGSNAPPSMEWFTAIAGVLCVPASSSAESMIGQLPTADRERAAQVLSLVIDALRQ
jgi:hypothetical protein